MRQSQLTERLGCVVVGLAIGALGALKQSDAVMILGFLVFALGIFPWKR